MNPLRVRELDLHLRQRHLLRHLSLDLYTGRCLVLTGVNGAGKSTLLRIIAGLQPADRIQLPDLGGRGPRPAARRLRRQVTYLHQHPYAFRGSVYANLKLALPWSLTRHPHRQRIREALEQADIVHLRDADASRLSGGERQRLSLARAWLRGTPYLLLDEPTANLDSASRERFNGMLRTLLDQGCGLLIATHDVAHFPFPDATRLHLEDGHLRLGTAPPQAAGKQEVCA